MGIKTAARLSALLAIAVCASGCAVFHAALGGANPSAEPALAGTPAIADEKISSPLDEGKDPQPTFRRASSGPRGITPCTDDDAMTSACRWRGDWHVEVERDVAPTPARYVPDDAAASTTPDL